MSYCDEVKVGIFEVRYQSPDAEGDAHQEWSQAIQGGSNPVTEN
jgi:hypothetical protein